MVLATSRTSSVEQLANYYVTNIPTFQGWGMEAIIVMCSVGVLLHWIKSMRGG